MIKSGHQGRLFMPSLYGFGCKQSGMNSVVRYEVCKVKGGRAGRERPGGP